MIVYLLKLRSMAGACMHTFVPSGSETTWMFTHGPCTAPHMCWRMVPAEVAISPSRWSQRQHGCVVYPSRSPTVGQSICICSAYASRQHRRVYMMLSPTVGPSHKLRNKIVLVKIKLTSIARALHVPFLVLLSASSWLSVCEV